MIDIFKTSNARRFGLLAFGDPNLDTVIAVDAVPRADQKCLGRRLDSFAGGTVANVACAASRLRIPAASYGRTGDDTAGEFLRMEFQRAGVSTAYLRSMPGKVSANALILLDKCGEKAVVYEPMPGSVLDPETISQALVDSRMVHAMPYDLEEFFELSKLAHGTGTAVSIDIETAMVSGPARLDALLALSDLVFMNERSFSDILKKPPTAANVRSLLERGPRVIVITRGGAGAIAVSRHQTVEQSAFRTQVVDATGAGDCFNGAFIAALLEGRSLMQATRFACAAASISVTAVGARSGLPDREAVSALLAAAGQSFDY
ncbi:carbohydrate kinase family protein [Collimonas fungivorans]|uniref:Ribokinase n=1 Tax=Collimonas fungivorans (strain Ter331) TaxID=1005048 RepID=G0AFQ6_COLFT|nr:carbohydrate kinase family protein [Collimonas fungivorans]AEK64145.1 Ribokinase [Collimonas fungivorans Ter331]